MRTLRAPIVVIGLVAALGVPTAPAAAGPGPEPMTETMTQTFTEPVSSVAVTSEAGSLAIRPGKPTKVVAEKHWLIQEPEVTMSVTDEVLRVDVTCPDVVLISIGGCWADLTLSVPERVSVEADLNAGDIDIASLVGDERLSTNAGSVKATRVIADRFQADANAGSVRLSRLETSTLEADSGSGDVSMSIVTARSLIADTNSGSVRLAKVEADTIEASAGSGNISVDSLIAPDSIHADANAGDVDIAVPAGVYAITADTNAGEVDVRGLTNRKTASREIVATTNSGSVSVHAR